MLLMRRAPSPAMATCFHPPTHPAGRGGREARLAWLSKAITPSVTRHQLAKGAAANHPPLPLPYGGARVRCRQVEVTRTMATMEPDEKKSFSFGGKRARPRKGIERQMLEGATYLKPPGSCLTRWPGMGINVEVECCEKSSIYILDPCEQVQVSECVGCRIVIGPCVGSALIFDCIDCTIAVAAKQTRLRDCANCELRSYAPTLECIVIETSKSLRFGCWDVCYPGLASQMRGQTKWLSNDETNYWDKIFDFSPEKEAGKSPNWTKLAGVDAAGRWCQLAITPEGLSGGTVVETRSDEPSVEGCDCPIAAQDGTLFAAPWYSAAADAAAAREADANKAATAAQPATSAADITLDGLGAKPDAAKGEKQQPGLLSRALNWIGSLFGKKAKEPTLVAGGTTGKETQVCAIS